LIDSIIFEKILNTGLIILNRPKALNALNLEMAELFLTQLEEWKLDKNIKRILITGEGKSFCAGGDIKAMFYSTGKSELKKNFLFKEYTLNYAINQFPKPYLSIWDGIVMGGGVGLSIYGNIRMATQNSKFAMPETAIGFFPDVGSSYFLSRISNNVGLYLALTGEVIGPKEMLYFGLANNFQNSEKIEKIKEKYIKRGIVPISENIKQTKTSEIINNKKFIEKTFRGNINSIMKLLEESSLEFANKTYEHLLTRCPMSLAITCELLKKAKNLSLKECLQIEYQLSQHIVYRNDFNNGIDAVLVSKTHNPIWSPSSIHDINFNDVTEFFKPHKEPLNLI
tara:strand:- start:40 stop:1056 length:1017 start_codon:yes stop_codon:yes gene_type:complete